MKVNSDLLFPGSVIGRAPASLLHFLVVNGYHRIHLQVCPCVR